MTALQQFSPGPIPFMGQFRTFRTIARGTSYHDVVGPIGTTTCQRDNVINVINIAHFLTAPIATSLLAFVLAFYIGCTMRAFSVLPVCPPRSRR